MTILKADIANYEGMKALTVAVARSDGRLQPGKFGTGERGRIMPKLMHGWVELDLSLTAYRKAG